MTWIFKVGFKYIRGIAFSMCGLGLRVAGIKNCGTEGLLRGSVGRFLRAKVLYAHL